MYKGILFVGLISLLVGCGGGGGSSSGVSNDRGEDVVDPYLGVWERSCSPVDHYYDMEISTYIDNLLQQHLFNGELTQLYLKEVLTVEPESMTLSMTLFLDDLCVEPQPILDFYVQVLMLDNIGGEIQVRDEWVSKNGHDFFRYTIPVNFMPGGYFPVALHNVDDRLYIVEPFETDIFLAIEEDYVVNFNKYYTRVLD